MDEKEKQRRERLLRQILRLMQAPVNDAVKLAYLQEEETERIDGLDLTALKEFKRSANGVVELKFVDRGRLLERLLDTVDHSGEDQVDRFLQAMEGEG